VPEFIQVWKKDSQRTSGGDSGKSFTNSTGMKFVYINPGSFTMGSINGDSDEKPVHKVKISRGFYMQTTEVTQGQWKTIMGDNPSHFKSCGDSCPVESVSWDDAQNFIKKLNQKEGKTYRLPTEAEWEYACRAGSDSDYANGNSLDVIGWYYGNSGRTTHSAGQKKANNWGLYDMHGNVWEWCNDWYADYSVGQVTDPSGSVSGSLRVYRGGSWDSYASGCRSAVRGRLTPGYRFVHLGLRLARTP
jgi:formylglycine-generating enzyme required for sulfatase activity